MPTTNRNYRSQKGKQQVADKTGKLGVGKKRGADHRKPQISGTQPEANRSGARCQFDEPHSGRHLHHSSGILQTGQRFPHPSLRKADGVRLFCQHRTGSRSRAVRFQEQMGTHQCQKATQRLRLRPDREVCELNFLAFYSTFALLNCLHGSSVIVFSSL